MVNLRSKSKGTAVAPGAALKTEPTIPTPPTAPNNVDLSEEALRKLPRAELQKLAMAHKVKANMKSGLIIEQLLSIEISKKKRPAEDDPEEGPSRKRFKNEVASEKVSISPEIQVALLVPQPPADISAQPSVGDPQPPEAASSVPQSIPPADKEPTVLSYDKDLFSGTSSEMTEEEQLDFATPVSSRSGTPPASNVIDLARCVTIMQQISMQDIMLLKEVTGVRETAAKLHKRARDVRDLVKAERGRRERVEAYFRYWQQIEPTWDRKWLYGEKTVQDHKIRLPDSDKTGPPTIPCRRGDLNSERPLQKPVLSPEELKKKREAIVSKQEAEQRQLEAVRRGKSPSREGSSRPSEHLISFEDGAGTMALMVPATTP